jgi:hypothetical protein
LSVIAHSIVGTAWKPTPWGEVQRAAWEILKEPEGRT